MNTQPINPLTDDGLEFLTNRLDDLRDALDGLEHDMQRDQAPVLERCERILPTELFNELVAYLGSIREHHRAICFVLFDENEDLRADGLVADVPPDQGEPTDPFAAHDEAIATLLDSLGQVPDDAFHRYGAQLDRGVITGREFEALVANYWEQRGMLDAADIEKCQWLYDHNLLDASQFHEAIGECWIEHIAGIMGQGDDPNRVSNCAMCACGSADEYANAYLSARYPQLTGAPSVCDPETTIG